MKSNANGISPIIALILTVIVGFLTYLTYKGGHPFWGTVLALITVDFAADLVLSFKKKA